MKKPNTPEIHDESLPVGEVIRDEVTVLPADEPQGRTLGFAMKTYDGGCVYLPDAPDEPLVRLYPGMQVCVPTIVGVCLMTVCRDEDGELYAEAGGTIATLDYDEDDRHCWTSSCLINTRAVTKLTVDIR